MPTDASIPLQVRPVPVENPAQLAGQYYSLAGMAQERELRGQQISAAQLENQQRQRALEAQTAVADAFKANTKLGDNGDIQFDHAGIQKTLADRGYGIEAMKVDAERRAQMKASLEAEEAALKVGAAKAERLSSIVGSVPPVDFSKDSTSVAGQSQAALAALRRAADTAHREGLLDQPHVDWVNQQQQYTPEVQDAITQMGSAGMKHAEQLKVAMDKVREIREQHTADVSNAHVQAETTAAGAQLDGIKATSAMKVRENAGAILGAAQTYGDYEQKRKDSPIGAQFPDFSGQPQNAPMTPAHRTAARQPAMTADQQTTTENQSQYHDDLLDLRQEQLNLRRDQLSREKGQTANDQAKDRRLAQHEFDQATLAESKLRQVRGSLEAAIASGNSYVDRLGNVVSIQKATAGGDNAATLLEQMKQRYQQISNDLRTTLTNKYDAGGRLGKDAQVSLDQTLHAVDADDERLFGPKKAAVPAPKETGKNSLSDMTKPVDVPITPKPAPAGAPATSQSSTTKTPAPQSWTIAGKAYKKGDPISIKGKTYTFLGLDASGKIQAQ
jgi:hypothetical protein